MDDLQVINTMGTTMFLAYTMLAVAYWIDAARWSKHAQELPPGPAKQEAQRICRRAENLFKWSTASMILAIICVVLPMYLPFWPVVTVCKYVILLLLVALLIMCVLYALGRYFVPIDLNQPGNGSPARGNDPAVALGRGATTEGEDAA